MQLRNTCVLGLGLFACAPQTDSGVGFGEDGETQASGDDTDSVGDGNDESTDDGNDGDDGPPKYDVGELPDAGGGQCGCGNELGFSYVWIANSGNSTFSKLNATSMVEEGRYLTRADANGDPSRTSVALSGRRAAVANRRGGVTAVWAREEFCDPDTNGVQGLQTSTGKDDVLPWGEDDCIIWSTPFNYTSQRPIAWTAGDLDEETCEYQNERVWTSGCGGGQGDAKAHLLDGDTGQSVQDVDVTGLSCSGIGGYGGAIDRDRNFWISNKSTDSTLARIDGETFEVTTWQMPVVAYGITVDHEGRVWVSASLAKNSGLLPQHQGQVSAARFDPESEEWVLAQEKIARGEGGIVEDAMGRMWITHWMGHTDLPGPGFSWIDVDTLEMSDPIAFPSQEAGAYPDGISVDVDGMVWVISLGGSGGAVRYDPETTLYDVYADLEWPYTYSDMTGWALQNATCSPEG
jgi:streptogramin lyase